MILSITFSKPEKIVQEKLGKNYKKVRIWKSADGALKAKNEYCAEFFTETQAFQKSFTEQQVEEFYKEHAGLTFKNVVCRTDAEEITTLTNRHGEIKTLSKKLSGSNGQNQIKSSFNKKKNYIINEGVVLPFLVKLGVMSREGKINAAKYDKFRQINRFLEFVADIFDDVKKLCVGDGEFTQERPLRITDFGSGKSYLTFAVYYYLHELKKVPVKIIGIDLKEDVIKDCQALAQECGYKDLSFVVGDVAKFNWEAKPDIMITLHACDTATDYALDFAIKNNTAAILSVPCCQHEINLALDKQKISDEHNFASLLKWGIIKERFSALVTDAVRAEILEQKGYGVQLLEFIDMEGTPKNLLIRAVKKQNPDSVNIERSKKRMQNLMNQLQVDQTLINLEK